LACHLFPEGTRYNPIYNQDVLQRSRHFAQQKGLKERKDFKKNFFD